MARFFRRRKFCRFTAEGVTEIDYKDIALLRTTSLRAVKLSLAVLLVQAQNISVSCLQTPHVSLRCFRTLIHTSNLANIRGIVDGYHSTR